MTIFSKITVSTGLTLLMLCQTSTAKIYEPDEYLNADTPEKRPREDPEFLPDLAELRYFDLVVKDTYGFDLEVANEKNLFTLGKWKELNGFHNPMLNNLQEYYYNGADLGLARDLHCVRQWVDDSDLDDILNLGINELNVNQAQVLRFYEDRGEKPMSCYVSNRGFIGGNKIDGFTGLTNDDQPFATVAMEIWPKLLREGQPNAVRFFVFGAPQFNNDPDTGIIAFLENNFFFGEDGYDVQDVNDATAIKLDNGNGHSQPGICVSCHGGELTADGEIISDKNVSPNFIPFYISLMEFPGKNIIGDRSNQVNGFFRGFVDREEAIDKFNQINSWIYFANKSGRNQLAQPSKVEKYLLDIYGEDYLAQLEFGDHSQVIPEPDEEYIVDGFRDNAAQRNFARDVYEPYCQTCHHTSSEDLTAENFFSIDQLGFKYLCEPYFRGQKDGLEIMPEAEVNYRNMRRHADFVKHHIAKNTGNPCTSMPTLVDFETDTDAYDYVAPLALNVFPIDDNSMVTKTRVIDINGNGVKDTDEFSIKRSLQIQPGLSNTSIRVEEEDFGISGSNKNTTRLSTLTFAYFLESANDNIKIEFVRNDNGNEVILPSDTIILQNPTTKGGNPAFLSRDLSSSIPNNTFAAIITLQRNSFNLHSMVELDDLQVEFDYTGSTPAHQVTKIIDFENQDILNQAGELQAHQLTTSTTTASGEDGYLVELCRKQRNSEIGINVSGWDRSKDFKVLRDPGRASYSTNENACAQDLMSFEIALNGNESERVNVSFDYRSNPHANLYLSVYAPSGRADPQDLHLAAAEAPHFGRFRVTNITADSTLTFTYAYKTRTDENFISAEFDDLEGASIDNIRVISVE